jgi:hypothetical protein
MLLRNVGCISTDYTPSHPRRWYSSSFRGFREENVSIKSVGTISVLRRARGDCPGSSPFNLALPVQNNFINSRNTQSERSTLLCIRTHGSDTVNMTLAPPADGAALCLDAGCMRQLGQVTCALQHSSSNKWFLVRISVDIFTFIISNSCF